MGRKKFSIAKFLDKATPRTLAYMDGFLAGELARRDDRHRALLLRQAGFPSVKSLSDYDFSSVTFPSDMPKETVVGLGVCDTKEIPKMINRIPHFDPSLGEG